MINALFSSRDGGTKQFQYEGVAFGWKAIEEMYAQECSKRTTGHAHMVPKLLRDSWTKLNVHPAKIMQVCFLFACDNKQSRKFCPDVVAFPCFAACIW